MIFTIYSLTNNTCGQLNNLKVPSVLIMLVDIYLIHFLNRTPEIGLDSRPKQSVGFGA